MMVNSSLLPVEILLSVATAYRLDNVVKRIVIISHGISITVKYTVICNHIHILHSRYLVLKSPSANNTLFNLAKLVSSDYKKIYTFMVTCIVIFGTEFFLSCTISTIFCIRYWSIRYRIFLTMFYFWYNGS